MTLFSLSSPTNLTQNFYFHHLTHLWNSLPAIDLTKPVKTIKQKSYIYMWKNFLQQFSDNNTHTYHYISFNAMQCRHWQNLPMVFSALSLYCKIIIKYPKSHVNVGWYIGFDPLRPLEVNQAFKMASFFFLFIFQQINCTVLES